MLLLIDGISFCASLIGVFIRSSVSRINRAVELMTPLSLAVDDGDGEGAGDGVAAADEPLLDEAEVSSKSGLWCGFLEASAAAA